MREEDIIHERDGGFWVGREKARTLYGNTIRSARYTVFRPYGTASISDSSYEATADGKSLAVARCDYLADAR